MSLIARLCVLPRRLHSYTLTRVCGYSEMLLLPICSGHSEKILHSITPEMGLSGHFDLSGIEGVQRINFEVGAPRAGKIAKPRLSV